MKIFRKLFAYALVFLLLFSFSTGMIGQAIGSGETAYLSTGYRCKKGSDTGERSEADPENYKHGNSTIRFLAVREGSSPSANRTGIYAYCIEMGAVFNNNTYKTSGLTSSSYWNSLSGTAQNGITCATMYGFPSDQYGVAKCDAYVATQIIIWEFQKGYRTMSGRTNAELYNSVIRGTPAERAYNAISAKITVHFTIPSFSSKNKNTAVSNAIKMKYDPVSQKYTAKLTDSNGILSGYNVTERNGLTVSKSGNTLTVTSPVPIASAVTVGLGRPVPAVDQALLALNSSNNQRCIIGQLQDPVANYVSFTADPATGSLKVVKTSDDNKNIAGIRFTLSGTNYSAVTDAAGIAVFTNIPVGTYTVAEDAKTVHGDYLAADAKKVTVAVNTEAKADFHNKLKTGIFRLKKVEEGADIPIENAVFRVQGISGRAEGFTQDITTNSEGIAVLEDLPLGEYEYKEISVPGGYVLDETVYTFDLTPKVLTAEKTVLNQATAIKITKRDLTTSEPIPGGEITIYDSDGKPVYQDVTREDGTITAFKLVPGKYTFKETLPPAGYQINDSVFTFTIDKDGRITGDNTITDAPTEVTITKKDLTTAEELPGCEITIYNAEAEEVFRDVTGEDGTVTAFRLVPGEYTFQETAAPDGYAINKTVFTFTIDKNGAITGDNTVMDKQTEVTITQKDAQTSEALPGCEIAVFDAEGNEVFRGVTDDKGTITVYKLTPGEYTFREISAPEGYVLEGKAYTFAVYDDGSVTGDVAAMNKKITGRISVYKYDKESNKPLSGAEFKIYSIDGQLMETLITDQFGYAHSSLLPYGSYSVKEAKAPEGYSLNLVAFKADIRKDGENICISIDNSRFPATGDSANIEIAVAVMLVSAACVLILFRKGSLAGTNSLRH